MVEASPRGPHPWALEQHTIEMGRYIEIIAIYWRYQYYRYHDYRICIFFFLFCCWGDRLQKSL